MQSNEHEFLQEELFTKIHIRVIKRTDRTYNTVIENLSADINYKRVLKYLKRICSCNGRIEQKDDKKVIVLQGNHGIIIRKFLIKNNLVDNINNILIHGI